jgi:hypothetical protein
MDHVQVTTFVVRELTAQVAQLATGVTKRQGDRWCKGKCDFSNKDTKHKAYVNVSCWDA